MKNLVRSTVSSLLLILASVAYGAVPAISVTVSDASGKAAFKGNTDAKGSFTTAKLQPGNYIVQFNARDDAVKGNHYTLIVSAGKKKVSASTVPGEKFTRGGVAMKVEVGAGLNISGQVAAEAAPTKNGKKMVWIPPVLGSNMPGHWAEEGSAEEVQSRNRGIISRDKIQDMQSKGVGMPGN